MPSFPRDVLDFQDRFGTERACWDYLVDVRWPGGVAACPRCGKPAVVFLEAKKHWRCVSGHQWSVTTGTVMHRSHLPLRKWFWAAYFMTTQTPGISAMVLHRQISVCYETAYMLLQRLRAGMVNPDRKKLSGKVEVDEAFISAGRKRVTRSGRGTKKVMVVVAVESRGGHAGRIRLRRIPDASSKTLGKFIRDHIDLDSELFTDDWQGYSRSATKGYRHVAKPSTGKHGSDEDGAKLPWVHKAIANLKAWLLGTHHGVSSKHLQAYLNEFAFRYNRRRNPQGAFLSVLRIGSHRGGPEYEGIYSADEPGGWKHPNPLRKKRRRT